MNEVFLFLKSPYIDIKYIYLNNQPNIRKKPFCFVVLVGFLTSVYFHQSFTLQIAMAKAISRNHQHIRHLYHSISSQQCRLTKPSFHLFHSVSNTPTTSKFLPLSPLVSLPFRPSKLIFWFCLSLFHGLLFSWITGYAFGSIGKWVHLLQVSVHPKFQ